MGGALGFIARLAAATMFLGSAWAQAPGSPAPPAGSPATDRILPLDVTVNGGKGGTWVFVERRGILYAPRDAFEEWRVQLDPQAATIDFRGETYWPLTAVPGFKAKVDFATQSVELLFSPEVFSSLRLSKEIEKRPPVSPVLPTVFLNYDASYTGSRFSGASNVNEFGVIAEAGVSGAWGVLTSSHVLRKFSNSLPQEGRTPSSVRLETTFTRDEPGHNRTLRIGDATTRGGLWGRAVYFGGVQYGTNFALSPGFVTQSLPALRGLSAAPSTVELYVNDVLRQVSKVPTGPFTIDNFPLMTGGGDAKIVVRDLLGRETVIEQSFFTNSLLLARGLDDWSVEAGKVRRNLGAESDDYGAAFASGTWRRGFTAEQTAELRAEFSSRVKNLGAGLVTGLPYQVLGTLSVAGSQVQDRGRGVRWLVGLERSWLRAYASVQAQGSDSRFGFLGQEGEAPLRRQVAGTFTWYAERVGTFGVAFASLERFGEARVSTLSANYSVNLPHRSSLMVAASRALAGQSANSIGVTFVMPLDDRTNLSGNVTRREGLTDGYVSASRTPTPESGSLGWRVLAGAQQDQARVEGGLYRVGDHGNVTGEVSHSPDRSTLRVGGSGGLVYAAGSAFATRRVDQAFAVAEVKGYPGVGMGVGSNVVTRTNADGVALVPNLMPYQVNSIRLSPGDLPVSAEIDSIELQVVPAWRSAVKVDFPVRSGRGALVRVVLDDGQPAPAGATVEVLGDPAQFYVARRGEAFVTGMNDRNQLQLNWHGRSCRFAVELPAASRDEIPKVGPYTCAGVPR